MSSAPPNVTPADPPLPGAPTSAPAWPDPAAIAQMANAFFQGQGGLNPLSPGIPVAPPDPTIAPAPSVVTTAAPFFPARTPYGPPDLPPTTIPSVAPTPNLTAPAAPASWQPSAFSPGLPDLPQPGASAGAFELPGLPPEADFAAFPELPGDATALAPPQALLPLAGFDFGLVPGESARPNLGRFYFLGDDRQLSPGVAALSPSSPAADETSTVVPAASPYTSLVSHSVPPATSNLSEPSQYAAPRGENFQLSPPSEADPHRFSDVASLATPDAPAPFLEGYDSSVSPGAAGPSPQDALYFVSHLGGHERALDPLPAQPKQPEPQSFAPQLAGDAAALRQPFDPYRVKGDFPILQQQVHGKPLIWLDNAATTQKPQAVIDRLTHFYEYENSNIHRAAHALAARATDAYEAAREKVRRFLKAPSAKDIIFVRGATEGINLVAQAWGRRNVQQGDEIVLTWLEHHANIVPWQQLCAEKGARLRVAPVDDRGQLILEEFEKLLNPKTKIVAVSQVSNALGTVSPVREITAMAHRHGACVLVDGAQSVSHMPVDVQTIDCDFFVFSGHKVFGPTGVGVVYGKDSVLEHIPPWQGGGNMIADVTFERTIYQGPPERFEAGTGNIADAVGLGAALDYVEGIGMEVIARYEHELLAYATEKISQVPGLTLIGTAAEKASVLSFVLAGREPGDVGKALDREGIAVRAGHHCAQPILRRFGLEATVRPSLAFYNTCADVDALVAALLKLQNGRG